MGGDQLAKITDQLKAKANTPENAAARDDAIAAVKSALSSDPDQRQQANDQAARGDRQADQRPGIDQARTQIQGYEDQYDQLVATAKQKGTDAANAAASAASKGALAASISLIVGCSGRLLRWSLRCGASAVAPDGNGVSKVAAVRRRDLIGLGFRGHQAFGRGRKTPHRKGKHVRSESVHAGIDRRCDLASCPALLFGSRAREDRTQREIGLGRRGRR